MQVAIARNRSTEVTSRHRRLLTNLIPGTSGLQPVLGKGHAIDHSGTSRLVSSGWILWAAGSGLTDSAQFCGLRSVTFGAE